MEQRPHDHHPLLHQRPEDPRRCPTRTCAGPAPPPCPMIPTTTGAAKAVGLVMPELKGKIDGFAVRVPTPNVSLVDFVGRAREGGHGRGDQRGLHEAAAAGPLKGILGVHRRAARLRATSCGDPPLRHRRRCSRPRSSDGNLVKVIAWYDNEWGYSCRAGRPGQVSSARASRQAMKLRSPTSTSRASGSSSASTSTSRSTSRARSRDDTRIRASLPTITCAPRPRRPARSSPPTSGGPRASPSPAHEPRAGRARGWPSSSRTGRPHGPRRASATRSRGCKRRPRARARSLLLENLRFHTEEEKNDAGLRRKLAERRATSSSTTPSARPTGPTPRPSASPSFVPVKAAGFLMKKEVEYLEQGASTPRPSPTSPSSAAPRSPTRSRSSRACSARPTTILIGGAMAYTFLKAQGLGGRQVARRGRPDRDRPGRSWTRPGRSAVGFHLPAGPRLLAAAAEAGARQGRRAACPSPRT
ncbi:MAG: phosphoglycerate kinase [Comamonadaceae bacterium]|nr:phosphoglycerate kinase [Comamonadaceae bacterium]